MNAGAAADKVEVLAAEAPWGLNFLLQGVVAGMSKYIDSESALTRVGGNMALYKKLLVKFKDGEYREKLEALITGGDIEGATAMAHTLKGVAANLSLTEVHALSLQIETALKNGGDYASLLPQLTEASEATLAEIDTL
jgi:HPt (histidine-containing phosphotransfer) domain-containing protein